MNASNHLQRLVRSRTVRIAAALLLIASSLWAFSPHIGYRIASTAFVNAEIERVSTPIAGKLASTFPQRGDLIERSIATPLVVAFSRDQRTLLRLASQIALARERSVLSRRQLAEIAADDHRLADRGKAFSDGIIAKLSSERDETKAEVTGCLAELKQRSDVRARMGQLVKAGTASEMRAAEAHAAEDAVATRCEMADARMRRLEAELAAAQAGVFLRDGINDAPYSQQQRDRLALRRQELETRLMEDDQQSAELATKELEMERERLTGLDTFSPSLPAGHVVWAVSATPGAMVTEGQSLLDLADCEKRFVTVEVSERDFELTEIGDSVDVRLIGGGEWRKGKVLQIRGSAAQSHNRLLAAQAPRPNRESVLVEVSFPKDPSQERTNTFCSIGRMAEVRFQRFNFDVLAGWKRKFQQLAGYAESGAVAGLEHSN